MNVPVKEAVDTAELVNTASSMTLKAQSASDVALQLVQVIGSLGLVIALVFALAYLVKRNQNFSGVTKKLAIVERLALNNKDQLLLVSVHGKEILLGVSAAGVNALQVFDLASVGESKEANQDTSTLQAIELPSSLLNKPKRSIFVTHLQQILAARMAS